jgi:hypothetical protein
MASRWHCTLPLNYFSLPILDLQLTLIDHNFQPTQRVPLKVNIRRNITLVPGYFYEVNCNPEMGGFGGRNDTWFHFNDTPVQQLSDTATPVNVYAMKVDTNNWKLVLKPFQETNSGVYTCRGGDSSSVSLDIRPGIYKTTGCTRACFAFNTFCVLRFLHIQRSMQLQQHAHWLFSSQGKPSWGFNYWFLCRQSHGLVINSWTMHPSWSSSRQSSNSDSICIW